MINNPSIVNVPTSDKLAGGRIQDPHTEIINRVDERGHDAGGYHVARGFSILWRCGENHLVVVDEDSPENPFAKGVGPDDILEAVSLRLGFLQTTNDRRDQFAGAQMLCNQAISELRSIRKPSLATGT